MKLEIDIPTLAGIKLKTYQRLLESGDNSKESIIEYLCSLDMSILNNIKSSSIDIIYKSILEELNSKPDVIKTFKLGDLEFGLITNFKEITEGELIDLQYNINNLSSINKALCVLYRPIVKKKRSWFSRRDDQYIIEKYNSDGLYEDLMKHTPLNVVFGVYLFLINLRESLFTSTFKFIENEIKRVKKDSPLYDELNLTLIELKRSYTLIPNVTSQIILDGSIKDILDMLKIAKHYNVSEEIEIANGKYEIPVGFKKLIKQIKRWILTKN